MPRNLLEETAVDTYLPVGTLYALDMNAKSCCHFLPRQRF